MKKLFVFLLLGVFFLNFASAEYYVDIYADVVNGSVGSVDVYNLTNGIYRVNATDGDYEVDRALVMKWLFYGTDGTDPRATATYMENPTKAVSLDARDDGKRGHYASFSLGGTASQSTYTGTFADTTTNTDCSSWSYLDSTGGLGVFINYQIPDDTVVNSIPDNTDTTIDETGTDRSADEKDNPADTQILGDDRAGETVTGRVLYVCSGAISWATVGVATTSNTDFLINESFPEFISSNITTTLNSPEDNFIELKNTNIVFNITSTSENKNLVNITLYINDTLNETKSLSGTEDTETFTKAFSLGYYNWSVEVCNNESVCITSDTRDFTIKNYKVNSLTYNTTSFETATETFSVNVSGNPTSAVLVYNGTAYGSTKSGDIFTKILQVPTGNLGNRSAYWRFDALENSDTFYQNVNETVFTLCNASYDEDYLNISFKDEGDLSFLNASIPTSTFEYYLGDGTLTKSYTFVNNSNHYNYTFCATPSTRDLYVLPTVQYKQGLIYPQRIWEPVVQIFNNTVMSQILYLLNTIDGLYVTFQVINPANQVLSGVEVKAVREIGGNNITVGIGTTGASGTVTLWLNPDFSHDFTFSKSGLTTISESFAPTQSSYTITMGGEVVIQNSTIRGIDYSIIPTNTFLENDTSYTFGFNLTSSFWDVDSYGFNLRLANGTIIIGDSTAVAGTDLTKSYDVNNQSLIYLDAYWIIDGNYTNITRYWAIQNTAYTEYSIAVFFTDLNTYMDSGLFGIDDFGRYLIAFIILFVSVGLMGYKFGISSPLGVLTLTFAIVFFLDIVTGTIPTIGGIENLPSLIAGLILTLAALNEVRLRI